MKKEIVVLVFIFVILTVLNYLCDAFLENIDISIVRNISVSLGVTGGVAIVYYLVKGIINRKNRF